MASKGLIDPEGGKDIQKAFREARSSPSFYAVMAANLLPLIGVVFLHWRLDVLILFYLVECVVTYFVTAKMVAFVGELRDQQQAARGFLLGGGTCLLAIVVFWGYFLGWFTELRADTSWILGFLLSATFMTASHVYAYLHNFIGRNEHERMPIGAITARWGGVLAGTVVVMLIFPVLGLLQSLIPFAAVLVAFKTLAALSAFVEDRARADGATATSITYAQPTARCPRCHQLLRTDQAKQCFHCGADWHKSAA